MLLKITQVLKLKDREQLAFDELKTRTMEEKAMRKRYKKAMGVFDYSKIKSITHKARTLTSTPNELCDNIDRQAELLSQEGSCDVDSSEIIVKNFINKRKVFLNDMNDLRVAMGNFARNKTLEKNRRHIPNDELLALKENLQEIMEELGKLDSVLTKERTTLQLSKSEIQLSIPGYEGGYESMLEAYAKCLTGCLLAPLSATILKHDQNNSVLQKAFRGRLVQRYDPSHVSNEPYVEHVGWCSLHGAMLRENLVPVHIIPHTIGGKNAAHLLGYEEDEGLERLWGGHNGIMLSKQIAQAFEKGQIVFAPPYERGFGGPRMMLLDRSLAGKLTSDQFGLTFGKMEGWSLQIEEKNLPSLLHFYIHALVSVLRCRRHNCSNWKRNLTEVLKWQYWPCFEEEKKPRRGILSALAMEIGDVSPSDVNKFGRYVDESGVIDVSQDKYRDEYQDEDEDEITEHDKQIAFAIAGTWMTQDELKYWTDLSDTFHEFWQEALAEAQESDSDSSDVSMESEIDSSENSTSSETNSSEASTNSETDSSEDSSSSGADMFYDSTDSK